MKRGGFKINHVFILRLFLASVLGGIIGIDREIKAKEAGIRTHFLVCLGGALIMIVSQHGFSDVIDLAGYKLDPARVAAQVVSGIGFIGAGMIIIQKESIKGLTSAAGIWTTAGIGLTIGGGLYFVGIIATGLTLIAFEMSKVVSKRINYKVISFKVVIKDKEKINDLFNLFHQENRYLKQYQLKEIINNGEQINCAKYTVQLKNSQEEEKVLEEIQAIESIIVKEVDYSIEGTSFP